MLNHKLSEGGGAATKFVGNISCFARLEWPSLISNFSRLVEFELHEVPTTRNLPCSVADLLSLPRTLRKLSLTLANAPLAFFGALHQDKFHFKDLEYLELGTRSMIPTEEEEDDEEVNANMGPVHITPKRFPAFPSTLRSLKLNLRSTDIYYNLEDLPTSLTTLHLALSYFECPSAGFKLPESVTDFKAMHTIGIRLPGEVRIDWLPHLPENLLSLDITILDDLDVPSWTDASVSRWTQIPRSLTYLSIQAEPSRKDFEALPANLAHFELWTEIDCERLLGFLPQKLQFLSISTLGTVTRSIAKVLPRTLTSMNDNFTYDALAALPFVPSNFSTYYAGTRSWNDVRLPPQLNSLGCGLMGGDRSAPISTPVILQLLDGLNRLTSIEIGQIQITKELMRAFPASLTNLHIWPKNKSNRDEFESSGVAFVESGALSLLPPNLTRFSFLSQFLSIDQHPNYACWPRNSLRTLVWEVEKDPTELPAESLPPSLTDIQATICICPSPAKLQLLHASCPLLNRLMLNLKVENAPSSDFMRFFPPSLHSLAIGLSTELVLSPEDISHLPPRLRSLGLEGMQGGGFSISEPCQDVLPRSLQNLSLHWRTPEWFLTHLKADTSKKER